MNTTDVINSKVNIIKSQDKVTNEYVEKEGASKVYPAHKIKLLWKYLTVKYLHGVVEEQIMEVKGI